MNPLLWLVDWYPLGSNRFVLTRCPPGDILGRRAMQGWGYFASDPLPRHRSPDFKKFLRLLYAFLRHSLEQSHQLRSQ